MKIEKISKMALYICVGIIVVCFVAFFGIGYSNPVGDYNEPKLLDLLMILMYAMFVVMMGLTVWSIFKGLGNKGGSTTSTSGVPGGKIMAGTIALLVISLVVGVLCGWGEEAFTGRYCDFWSLGDCCGYVLHIQRHPVPGCSCGCGCQHDRHHDYNGQ